MSATPETIAARSAEVILGPNPIVGLRIRDLALEAARAMGLAARQPLLTARAVADFGGELLRIVQGESELRPAPKDRRWGDPGNKRAEFWSEGELDSDADAWRDGATHHAGSWWRHWYEWLRSRSGAKRAAPEGLGSEEYPTLVAAPGTYVHE
jgi:hypothetical protein